MATAEQMEVQRAGNTRIREVLSADLNRFWGSLDLADRDGVREAVLTLSPALADRFGAMSAALSAGFFEDTVNATPIIADARNDEQVGESARWAIGPLWEDNPDQALAQLTAALTRLALRYGRETIHKSAMNTRGVSYAWVPGDLCPYCVELGSRGAVFGISRSTDALHFHDSCVCELVPSRSADDYPPGYDPAALKTMHAEMVAEGKV